MKFYIISIIRADLNEGVRFLIKIFIRSCMGESLNKVYTCIVYKAESLLQICTTNHLIQNDQT